MNKAKTFIKDLWAIFLKKRDYRYFRIKIIIFFVTFVFLIIQIRLFSIFHSSKARLLREKAAISQDVESENEEPEEESHVSRLDIVDRNNTLLARNVIAFDFYIYPNKMIDCEGDLNKIINIFPTLESRKEKILEMIKSKISEGKGAVLVKQNIFPVDKQRILNSGILGVEFQETERRIYPHNNTASHLLGFLSVDGVGMMGVERYFDGYLKNTERKSPLQLSIDINIQNITKHILAQAIKKNNAKAGVALIVKVKTGELISAVSLPDFNPNNLSNYNNDDLFNRFSHGVYELGSVFKIFLVAMALESGISPEKEYNTKDPFVVGDFTIHNFAADQVREKMNMFGILTHSSNIGCARMIEEIGNFYKQKEMFQKLGLLDKINIELPEIGKPIYADRWRLTQAITRSYGHGIAVPPINFIYAVASIINNGKVIRPTLLKAPDKSNATTELPGYVIGEKTSKKVRDILRLVVKEGTGKQSAAEKYDVGGKTGTAIKQASSGDARIRNLAYTRFKNLVSFFAAVPMKDPEYIYYILLDEPSSENKNVLRISGGRMVAPAMGELISITGPMLNIPIESN